MATVAQNIRNFINTWIKGDAVLAFQNNRLNTALNMLNSSVETLAAGVTGSGGAVIHVTGEDFINATDCPITILNGRNIEVFSNAVSRFLIKTDSEWTDLVGGGFKILIPGYDVTAAENHFFIYTV